MASKDKKSSKEIRAGLKIKPSKGSAAGYLKNRGDYIDDVASGKTKKSQKEWSK